MRTTASETVHNDSHRRFRKIAKFLVDFRRIKSCFVGKLCVLVHSLIRWRLRRRDRLVKKRVRRNLVEWELKERTVGSESVRCMESFMIHELLCKSRGDLCKPIFRRKDVKLRVDLFRGLWKHIDVAERPWVFEATQLTVTNDIRLPLLSVLRRADLPLGHRLLDRFDHLEFFLELIFMTRTGTCKDIWKQSTKLVAVLNTQLDFHLITRPPIHIICLLTLVIAIKLVSNLALSCGKRNNKSRGTKTKQFVLCKT